MQSVSRSGQLCFQNYSPNFALLTPSTTITLRARDVLIFELGARESARNLHKNMCVIPHPLPPPELNSLKINGIGFGKVIYSILTCWRLFTITLKRGSLSLLRTHHRHRTSSGVLSPRSARCENASIVSVDIPVPLSVPLLSPPQLDCKHL